MNYYERHLGDYAKDTKSLSMLEHGAYNLLLDYYYATESGLPNTKIYRIAGAVSKAERAAVDAVLSTFFSLVDDFWMKNRVEEEIEKYRSSLPAASEKRENDKLRQRRARDRRKYLFDQLNSHGITLPFSTSTQTLHAELSRVTSRDKHAEVTRDYTATRHQTPDTRHQIPSQSENSYRDSTDASLTQKPISLGKFAMTLDWIPTPDVLDAVLLRSGNPRSVVTDQALVNFREYFSQELNVHTESQWCQKLMLSAKRDALRNPPIPPHSETDLRAKADALGQEIYDEFHAKTTR